VTSSYGEKRRRTAEISAREPIASTLAHRRGADPRADNSEQIGKLIDGEPGLSKDGMERTCRQVLPMQGHDGLPVRLGLMPQKAVRTFDPHHPKAGTLQR
jgi:hypothetical protein